MKHTKYIIGLIILIIVIGILTKKDSSNKQEVKPIKIGVISPMTGSGSTYGEPIGNVSILAAEEINAAGGISGRPIELIVEDGSCESRNAVNAVTKLINQDNVSIVLGGGCSTESLAIAPILNRNKIIQIAAATSANNYSDAGPYSFRVMPKSDTIFRNLGEYAVSKGFDEISILYENKDYPRSTIDSFKGGYKNAGGEIASEQTFAPDEIDIRTHLTKIKEDNVRALMFAAQDVDGAIRFFTQLSELGMKDDYTFFVDLTTLTQKVYDETNGLVANRAFNTTPYVSDESDSMQKLLNAYEKRFGEQHGTTNFWVASSYDRLYLVKEAVEACNGDETDSDCLRNYLHTISDWGGVSGISSFDHNGDVQVPVFLHYFNENGEELWQKI